MSGKHKRKSPCRNLDNSPKFQPSCIQCQLPKSRHFPENIAEVLERPLSALVKIQIKLHLTSQSDTQSMNEGWSLDRLIIYVMFCTWLETLCHSLIRQDADNNTLNACNIFCLISGPSPNQRMKILLIYNTAIAVVKMNSYNIRICWVQFSPV